MRGITVVALGSHGTYGHLVLASELSRLARALNLPLDVALLTEDLELPTFLKKSFCTVTRLRQRPQSCSRGGALNEPYTGPDIESALATHRDRIWVFSTFFDAALVREARRRGCYCVWMSHPMRESFWQLFLLDNYCSLFDQLLVLDDLLPRQELPATLRHRAVLLPPPQHSAVSRPIASAGCPDGAQRVLFSCGGGLVNGSSDVLRRSLESLARLGCPDNITVAIAPGEVSDLTWLDALPFPVSIVRGDLGTQMDNATLLVCQAGYCTVHELIQKHLPAILVPAPRQIDDQELRAVLASRATGVKVVLPSQIGLVGECVIDFLSNTSALSDCRQRLGALPQKRGWDTVGTAEWQQLLRAWTAPSAPAD